MFLEKKLNKITGKISLRPEKGFFLPFQELKLTMIIYLFYITR